MASPKQPSVEQMLEELRQQAVGPKQPFDPIGNVKRTLQSMMQTISAVPGNIRSFATDPAAYVRNLPAPTGDQIMNALGPGNIGMAGIMIGPKAKTWHTGRADMAEAMEQAGRTPQEIWYATGTYRGPDGKWRQEIDDSRSVHRGPEQIKAKAAEMMAQQEALKAGVKESLARGKEVVSDLFPKEAVAARKAAKEQAAGINDQLGGYFGLKQDPKTRGNAMPHGFEHPELYAAYPELQNYVLKQGNQAQPGVLGFISGRDVEVTPSGLANNPRSTLTHELQHAIQDIEGWPRGGNEMEFRTARARAEQSLRFHNEELQKLAQKMDEVQNPFLQAELKERYNEVLNNRNKLVPYTQMDPYQEYRLLGGEAESRMTQERLNMSPEQRSQTFPLGSYDVNPKHLRLLDQGEQLDIYKAKGGSVEPKKTVKAYKLFRVHPDHPGKLFPLFVDANTPVEMGKWVAAKEGEMRNGKVKSKIGDLAYRPGWHAGDLPIATHIGEKSDPSLTAPDRRPANHAWAEVEMPNDVDWQSEATRRGTNAQGKVVPVKAHITDQIPHGGHYRYKTNPNMTGNWLIGGSMKVNRVLSDAEVNRINQAAGLADLPRSTPFNKKQFGFAAGGTVAPEEWIAEEHTNHLAGGGQPSIEQMKLALNKQGMYSPLEKAAINVPRTKGTPAEFMAEVSKQPGFRKDEVADRRISLPEQKMTKPEFVKHLQSHPSPKIIERVLGGNDYQEELDNAAKYLRGDEDATFDDLTWNQQKAVKYDAEQNWGYNPEPQYDSPDYNLPGGENYREILLMTPQQGLNEREREKKMWIEATARRGDLNPKEQAELEALNRKDQQGSKDFQSGHWKEHPNVLAHIRMADRRGPNGEKILHVEEIQSDWHQTGRKEGYREGDAEHSENRRLVPGAPFKKNWHELAMKHVLGMAAKGGYHGIAITPGEEQEKRWNEPGLRVQYDKTLPEFLNKLGKPHGAQVGTMNLKTPRDREPASGEDMSEFHNMSWDEFSNHPQRASLEKQFWQAQKNATTPMHYFPITDTLRQQIKTEGLPQYEKGGIIHKAEGGIVPTIEQMKAALGRVPGFTGLSQLQSVGAHEAPSLNIKAYIPPSGRPDNGVMPVGGVDTEQGNLPIGGIDMSRMQPGQQLMPQQAPQRPQQGAPVPQGALPQQQPQQQPQKPQAGGSSILQLTPQGQAMAAMGGQGMAKGGSAKAKPSIEEMKRELAGNKSKAAPKVSSGDDDEEEAAPSKRITIRAQGPGGVTGIVVPHHMWHGRSWVSKKTGKQVVVPGMEEINKARAQVYGSENRDPLSIGKMGAIHKQTLEEHFKKPLKQQLADEEEATERLRAAKHLGEKANTLDKSEKLDTVNHEHDAQGRTYIGFASKGIAGHALYTSGHGENAKHHIINTCPGQTEGCGGGKDAQGIVDTSRGTCFAPNAESQYVHAAVRRATHEQAKHDPAMTRDWILAHTGSIRKAANNGDKKNKVLLFRPNVVDETDVSSRHVIRHLNSQRKAENKPEIVANSYGKTNELHDPENGYYVTHSNVGPKVKKGQEVSENIGRDRARVRNTITATDAGGKDFTNEQGNKTPPKGSYMVTDVKRGSPLSKQMEQHITHAKYWSTGRSQDELSDKEKAEGDEGHYGPTGRSTTPEKAHYGHRTVNGLRFDYQKQHILHPRLVQVGLNKDGTPHMIPTDSRFKDTEFLPKNRFKTKNGKEAGHILMTTPTESTSNLGHETSFTHNVSPAHIKHAMENKGEYEIDKPEDQIKAKGKEYAAPQPVKFMAEGGNVGRHHGYGEDDFHAFPESNLAAQRHLAMRRGDDEEAPRGKHTHKPSVKVHKDIDTMRYEMTMKAK